jgi:hypothetical protein
MTYWTDDRRLDMEQRRLDAAQEKAAVGMAKDYHHAVADAIHAKRVAENMNRDTACASIIAASGKSINPVYLTRIELDWKHLPERIAESRRYNKQED